MAWYDDERRLTYIASYKDERAATRELERATRKGWVPQGTTATGDRANLGAAAGAALLFGPVGLLAAGNTVKGRLTITYTRSPEWHAYKDGGPAPTYPEQPRAGLPLWLKIIGWLVLWPILAAYFFLRWLAPIVWGALRWLASIARRFLRWLAPIAWRALRRGAAMLRERLARPRVPAA